MIYKQNTVFRLSSIVRLEVGRVIQKGEIPSEVEEKIIELPLKDGLAIERMFSDDDISQDFSSLVVSFIRPVYKDKEVFITVDHVQGGDEEHPEMTRYDEYVISEEDQKLYKEILQEGMTLLSEACNIKPKKHSLIKRKKEEK